MAPFWTLNDMRSWLLIGFAICSVVSPTEPASAGPACDKNPDHPKCGGGDPPPPTGCTDVFPSFLYTNPGNRKTPPALYMASSDGCRSELVNGDPDLRQASLYLSADRAYGVIVWSERTDIPQQQIVMRQDFSVASDGALFFDTPVQILPRAGEEPAATDYDFYFSLDIWGGASPTELYLGVSNSREVISGDGKKIDTFRIYDLNDMSQVRELFREEDGISNWSCPAVPFPQFVATCYNLFGAKFNASGTRIYFADNLDDPQGNRWDATIRIDVGMNGSLADWTFGTPEIVLAGRDEEPHAVMARPGGNRFNLPSPEIIAVDYLDRSGNNTVAAATYLDADTCAGFDFYGALAGGNTPAPSDFWMGCIAPGLLPGDEAGAWQTPDAVIFRRLENRHSANLYRRYISGALGGIEELIIENGEHPVIAY